MYFAHSLDSASSPDDWHKLQDHLTATGAGAEAFAREFGAQRAAKLAGVLHDLGKYSAPFQQRLCGSDRSVDHSTAGAREVARLAGGSDAMDKVMAQIISGQHAAEANS